MKSEWCYYKGHFTDNQCNQIIEEALKLPEETGTLGAFTNAVNTEWRRSSVRGILRKPIWLWLFAEVEKLVAEANNQFFNVDYKWLPEIQFATYYGDQQGFYKRHQDAFLLLPSNRKLSFTVQLTDPNEYVGGNLQFLDVTHQPNADNLRVRGTVCVFPSIMFHEVTPVTEGIRYSLAGWFEGPPWR